MTARIALTGMIKSGSMAQIVIRTKMVRISRKKMKNLKEMNMNMKSSK